MDHDPDKEEADQVFYTCWECNSKLQSPHFVMRSLKGWLVEPWILPVAMDPEVWSNLPEEVLAKCVAKLPADSRLRFLLVSKQWRERLRSPAFQAMCDEDSPGPASCPPICALEYHHGQFLPCRYPTDVSRLTSEFSEVHRLEFRKAFPERFKQLPDSCWVLQQGLVCMFRHNQQATELCLLNPVTQQWLEPAAHFSVAEYDQFVHKKVQMRVEPSGQFELLVVDRTSKLSRFSSKAAAWTRVRLEERPDQILWRSVGPYGWERRPLHWPQYVSCKGLLFVADRIEPLQREIVIRVYSLEDGRLIRELDRDSYPANTAYKLLEHRDRLFVVSYGPSMPLDYHVWEMDPDTFQWTMLSALSGYLQLLLLKPGALLPMDLDRRVHEQWMHLRDVVVVGRYLCLTIDEFESMLSGEHNLTHIVAFDIEDSSWSLVCRRIVHRRLSSEYRLFTPTLQEF